VYKAAYANAGPDKNILLGDTVTLNGVVQGTAVNYYWSPAAYINNTQAATPQVYPPADMQYTLSVNSTVGCGAAIRVVKVKVYKDIYIPSAFTPNGDGHNDVFRVTPLDNYTLARMTIYNRWGKIVFNTANAGDGWDGTFNQYPQPPGAYIYYLEFKLPEGKKLLKKGTVLLMR
jgi:gliding motility-associated-like protein